MTSKQGKAFAILEKDLALCPVSPEEAYTFYCDWDGITYKWRDVWPEISNDRWSVKLNFDDAENVQ